MDQKKIGNFLRELRKSNNLTQEQVAEKLGVSGRTISRWETGAYMPDISMLVDIAEMYDVDVREIIDGERKEDHMNSEVKEVAEKMADYSTMEKRSIFKWLKMMSIGTIIISICLIIMSIIRPFTINKTMQYDWHTALRVLLGNMISPDVLLMYIMFIFSVVVYLYASGRFQVVGQNSRTVKVTKCVSVATIVLSIAAVIEDIVMLIYYGTM